MTARHRTELAPFAVDMARRYYWASPAARRCTVGKCLASIPSAGRAARVGCRRDPLCSAPSGQLGRLGTPIGRLDPVAGPDQVRADGNTHPAQSYQPTSGITGDSDQGRKSAA
jgi:hypothetical protein